MLSSSDDSLFKKADAVRAQYIGPGVELRALIEFSNYCKQNCVYCGLRCANDKITRYRMQPEEIIALAAKAKDWGYKTIVLQSGEDGWYNIERMRRVISAINQLGLALTLSIGEKTFDEYKAYKEAGANRYLLRIETSDKKFYESLNPGMSFDNRLRCLHDLQKLDYEVGSGIMVGLPGQTIESIAKDILFLQNLPVDMAGIGPFIAAPDTPLSRETGNHFDLALRVMAVLRILMPDINIPATTAMETLRPDGRVTALQSGANVIMPNITDWQYAKNYNIYKNKYYSNLTPEQFRAALATRLSAIGRTIGTGYGISKKYQADRHKK